MEALVLVALFGVPLTIIFGAPIVRTLVTGRHERQMKELEIRELEAKAKLVEAEARAALPAFVDASDPESVAAYKRARQEVSRAREL